MSNKAKGTGVPGETFVLVVDLSSKMGDGHVNAAVRNGVN